jgi:hypothetical protein
VELQNCVKNVVHLSEFDQQGNPLRIVLTMKHPSPSGRVTSIGTKTLELTRMVSQRACRRRRNALANVIEESTDAAVTTNHTRWVDSVQVKVTENQEVYVTFSPFRAHLARVQETAIGVRCPETGQNGAS